MKQFEYFSADSVETALQLLKEYSGEAQILAGGTDLIIELRKPNVKVPKAIIDIFQINELKGISETDSEIIIKPLTTHTELGKSPIIKKYARLLHMAANVIGSPQIRNRGTIGGNIMNAATCADTVPPLIALGASLKLKSANGERTLLIADLFVKPYVTIATKDELLIEIRFPKLPQDARSAFIKLGRRNALAISRLSVAAILQKDTAGNIVDARIVPGAAFPKWQRVIEAEHILIGKKPDMKLFEETGKKVAEAMISFTGRRWSTEYKEPVIAVLVRRVLENCR